jgi:hypothetical protein
MRLAGEVESKIVELRGGRISSRSDGWARDWTRAMVGVALSEHSNIKVWRRLLSELNSTARNLSNILCLFSFVDQNC